jgi:hypothetical protein
LITLIMLGEEYKLWSSSLFWFHKMLGSSWVAIQLAASQKGLSSVSECSGVVTLSSSPFSCFPFGSPYLSLSLQLRRFDVPPCGFRTTSLHLIICLCRIHVLWHVPVFTCVLCLVWYCALGVFPVPWSWSVS